MEDIAALRELGRAIETLRDLPSPPKELKVVEAFRNQQRQVFNDAAKVLENVGKYAESILLKIDELKKTISHQIKVLQQAIEDVIKSIKDQYPSFPIRDDPRMLVEYALDKKTIDQMKTLRALEEAAKDILLDRLNELIQNTEDKINKLNKSIILTQNDFDDLKGCLDSWKNAKKMSHAAELEQKRIDDENRKKAAEEKRKQLEADRQKREEERKQREEEIKKQHEEEERKATAERERIQFEKESQRKRLEEEKRKAEEERLRREEEQKRAEEERKALEQKQRIEEEIRQRAEEARLRQEELHRQREEEEDRKKKAEEERIRIKKEREMKREEARQLRLKEEAEREKKRKEEEERAQRLNPNNWKPIIFERPCDEVDGRRPYHEGLCCMVASPSDEIQQDSVQCTASDEIDDIIETLDEDERPASSLIKVQTTSHSVSTECPSRIYLPHNPVSSASEELVIKYSINGSDWLTSEVIRPTQLIEDNEEFSTSNLIGVEANDFDMLKILVVSRPKSQNVIIDKAGLTVTSTTDKNVKLFTPRDAFSTRTNVRLSVINKTLDADVSTVDSDLISQVISLGPMITIVCDKAPTKDLEVDIARPASEPGFRQRGTRHHLIMSRGKVWSFAEREYKDTSNIVISVKLPANRERYTIVEVELPSTSPKENALKLAQSYHTQSLKTRVHVVLRQHAKNPQNAKIVVVQPNALNAQLQRLSDDGFTLGQDDYSILSLREGQRLYLSSRGNVKISDVDNGTVSFTFYKYMNEINKNVKLQAKDIYLQRDLQEYNGLLQFTVDNGTEHPEEKIEFTVHLPKVDAPRGQREVHRIRFPYYLTSLAGYLSKCICDKQTEIWRDIVGCFIDKTQLQSLVRVAKGRVLEVDQRTLCRNVLHDWMKQTSKQDDKVQIILESLYSHHHTDIYENCKQFVRYQKGTMTDKALAAIAPSVTMSPDELASVLSIQPEMLQAIKADYTGVELIVQLLTEWRESDDAINLGEDALEELQKLILK
ncbi:reticulocyte-binding protein homolog 2a-like [Dreissena polymorpha]|nr:reticulocyte-binding protein homolog 2a-like [Dreissena polymorpha]XP_052215339.1 reticulocyte-binding protein homolog 2a-like [Dreissena polymorpha]